MVKWSFIHNDSVLISGQEDEFSLHHELLNQYSHFYRPTADSMPDVKGVRIHDKADALEKQSSPISNSQNKWLSSDRIKSSNANSEKALLTNWVMLPPPDLQKIKFRVFIIRVYPYPSFFLPSDTKISALTTMQNLLQAGTASKTYWWLLYDISNRQWSVIN